MTTQAQALTWAYRLLWFTVAWNAIEGIVAIASGVSAGSIALIGFGADSYIEVLAAGVLLWRLRLPPEDEQAEYRERQALFGVGLTFLALALYVSVEAGTSLLRGQEAQESTIGVALAVISLIVMPALALAKLRMAYYGRSAALAAEAKETLAGSYLSFTLLIGLIANALLGWGWADAVAALAMVPWLVKEGWEGIHGEACQRVGHLCSCFHCIYGVLSCPGDCCDKGCCVAKPAGKLF